MHGVFEEKSDEQSLYSHLTLRLPDGEKIILFDSRQRGGGTMLLSDQLIPGTKYHLLLAVRAYHVRYLSEIPPDTTFRLRTKETVLPLVDDMSIVGQETVQQNEVTQGKVLDPDWSADNQQYQAVATPRIYQQSYILLQTIIGNILLSRRSIEPDLGERLAQIAPGGYIEWEPSRLDLLAVVDGQLNQYARKDHLRS